MRVLRKDYTALPDETLDRLKAEVLPILGTLGYMNLSAKTVYWLVMEVIDSREEIFRLQLCETVDQILAEELARGLEEVEFPTIQWPDQRYLVSEMQDSMRVEIPAFPCKETAELPRQEAPETTPEQDGRRLPRVE